MYSRAHCSVLSCSFPRQQNSFDHLCFWVRLFFFFLLSFCGIFTVILNNYRYFICSSILQYIVSFVQRDSFLVAKHTKVSLHPIICIFNLFIYSYFSLTGSKSVSGKFTYEKIFSQLHSHFEIQWNKQKRDNH